MEGKMKLKCGCIIHSSGYGDDWIEFCPLHNAAGDLLEALETCVLMLRVSKCTAAVLNPLEEIIAKAKGEE